MPSLKRSTLALLGLFVLIAIGEWLNLYAPTDSWFFNLSLSLSSAQLDKNVDYVAALGGTSVVGIWVLCLLAGAWWRTETRTLVGVGIVVLVVGELIEVVCKTVIVHPGPQARILDLASLPFEANGSFPSGHALRVAVVSSITAMVLTKSWPTRRAIWWALAILVTVAVSAARVYLADHWFSDVLGSWILAAGLLCAAFELAPSFKSRFFH